MFIDKVCIYEGFVWKFVCESGWEWEMISAMYVCKKLLSHPSIHPCSERERNSYEVHFFQTRVFAKRMFLIRI